LRDGERFNQDRLMPDRLWRKTTMSLSRLTPRAQTKWETLIESENDAQTLSTSTLQRLSELRHLDSVSGEGGRGLDYEREIDRLKAKHIAQQECHLQLAFITTRVRNFIHTLPTNVIIGDAKLPKLKHKTGEPHRAALNRIRAEIAELGHRRREVEACGLPLEEMKAQVRDWVSESARKATPRIRADHSGFGVDLAATTFGTTINVQDILAWFDPERVMSKLNEAIAAMPKPKLAMTPAEKEQAFSTLTASLLDHELIEEALIEAAAQGGMTIARRTDVSPQAVLGLSIEIQAAVKAA
jgi:hypothetical protein